MLAVFTDWLGTLGAHHKQIMQNTQGETHTQHILSQYALAVTLTHLTLPVPHLTHTQHPPPTLQVR